MDDLWKNFWPENYWKQFWTPWYNINKDTQNNQYWYTNKWNVWWNLSILSGTVKQLNSELPSLEDTKKFSQTVWYNNLLGSNKKRDENWYYNVWDSIYIWMDD